MRKIKAVNRNDNDRIICVTADGRHDFYYQPVGSKRRHWLVSCSFSGSIFAYFRDKGRNMDGLGFSLTIRELYRFRSYGNAKLAHLMERIPGQVDYVLDELRREAEEQKLVVIEGFGRDERSDFCEYEPAC